jgi:hypothetical protein
MVGAILHIGENEFEKKIFEYIYKRYVEKS